MLAIFFSSCNPKNPIDFSPRIYKQILKAQEYIKLGKYEKAISEYNHILDDLPPLDLRVKIFYQLGDLYSISMGDFEKGITFFNKVKKNTQDPIWLLKSQEKLGEIYFTFKKDFEESSQVYSELISFRPKLNNYQFYEYRYAQSLLKINESTKLKQVLNSIINNKSHEYFKEGYYLFGYSYFQNKEWSKAIGYFKEYLKYETRRDRVVNVKFLIGNCYETLERLKSAYNIYYSILGEYPNNAVIQDRLESVYQRRVSRKR